MPLQRELGQPGAALTFAPIAAGRLLGSRGGVALALAPASPLADDPADNRRLGQVSRRGLPFTPDTAGGGGRPGGVEAPPSITPQRPGVAHLRRSAPE